MVAGTQPSHPLDDYVGEFDHPAYGVVTVAKKEAGLRFNFHEIDLPLAHFHVEFVVGPDGAVTALKQIDPSGEFVSPRQ